MPHVFPLLAGGASPRQARVRDHHALHRRDAARVLGPGIGVANALRTRPNAGQSVFRYSITAFESSPRSAMNGWPPRGSRLRSVLNVVARAERRGGIAGRDADLLEIEGRLAVDDEARGPQRRLRREDREARPLAGVTVRRARPDARQHRRNVARRPTGGPDARPPTTSFGIVGGGDEVVGHRERPGRVGVDVVDGNDLLDVALRAAVVLVGAVAPGAGLLEQGLALARRGPRRWAAGKRRSRGR